MNQLRLFEAAQVSLSQTVARKLWFAATMHDIKQPLRNDAKYIKLKCVWKNIQKPKPN